MEDIDQQPAPATLQPPPTPDAGDAALTQRPGSSGAAHITQQIVEGHLRDAQRPLCDDERRLEIELGALR